MLRLALTPRWLVGLLVLLLLVAAAILLGRWQWDRTQSILAAERAAASEPVDVGEVLGPDAAEATQVPDDGIGHPVTVSGSFDPDLQVAVVNRSLDDRPGVWIVTGLRRPDGSVMPVLRGWLPDAQAPGAAAPVGEVVVTGILQPDEEFYADAVTDEGTVAAINRDRLVREWGTPVLPGFVVMQAQEPASSSGPELVPPTVQTADVPFPLQNFFYAFQWWIFAAFGVVVYVRWLWIESRDVHDDAAGATVD
jgi:cytochrome oxidase assembly protein ShyY1